MLRAVRLAAKLEFTIAADARAPFDELGELLLQAPPARLFDESLKMFMAGSGLKSFRALDASGLLADVYPLTARALAIRSGATFRAMIEQGMANTDARVTEGKPVTPAFLFAILLWGPVRAQVEKELARGTDMNLAWIRIGNLVMNEQSKHVAIPRRFALAIEEIWSLQPRFENRQKKRVFRLLAHPRFRAAYDFLLLRTGESAETAALAEWWTQAQTLEHDDLAAQMNSMPAAPAVATEDASDAVAAAPKKRPRRRRKRPPGDAMQAPSE